MENPEQEIPQIISTLTQTPPALQSRTIDKYFTPNATFVHPFCRIQSFDNSRWVVKKIYQWYKIMSPRIEMRVHSVALDKPNLKLYVTMSQVFTIWIIPFHIARVTLTTVLDLTTDPTGSSLPSGPKRGKEKYYISKQEDLYQTSEFVKFILPHVGYWIVVGMHAFATVFCVLGVFLWAPFVFLEERGLLGGLLGRGNVAGSVRTYI
ncbi:hypothetical protein BDV25DRAFT_137514 [Aspergillus avenaceus]|uniref:SigF-like NTF2-like domain-containing protein n=1 Tax=Aspergillus avenaceus TaxID=36643 RepID=A0A5N6U3K9_ASPAV|nr:hypothetical protein BDV25DRAFT_137514 [Aspergillus avenaceus]